MSVGIRARWSQRAVKSTGPAHALCQVSRTLSASQAHVVFANLCRRDSVFLASVVRDPRERVVRRLQALAPVVRRGAAWVQLARRVLALGAGTAVALLVAVGTMVRCGARIWYARVRRDATVVGVVALLGVGRAVNAVVFALAPVPCYSRRTYACKASTATCCLRVYASEEVLSAFCVAKLPGGAVPPGVTLAVSE